MTSSPTEFTSITGNYQITNGVVSTRDLLYTSRGMKVGVAGDYGLASGRMNLDLRVDHGRGELRARVAGNAASPIDQSRPDEARRRRQPRAARGGLQEIEALRRYGRWSRDSACRAEAPAAELSLLDQPDEEGVELVVFQVALRPSGRRRPIGARDGARAGFSRSVRHAGVRSSASIAWNPARPSRPR